eukprot:CAMPEP_0195520560 /NCGR_PEP_ID=MMETSP0794_2-20130614/17165_1 /TAXON_ID=515487 /ORGANISM="Stephanopyxis turris, Strain CCMP 815" /LENGTH=42 /DNA_ID= /DNA_START= /DNA_END= /DNA_ORIENTATION=
MITYSVERNTIQNDRMNSTKKGEEQVLGVICSFDEGRNENAV